MTQNAQVTHRHRTEYRSPEDRKDDLQWTLRRLTSKLLLEGTLEDIRARKTFHSKRHKEKLKRGRKTGPKHYARSHGRFTLKNEEAH